LFRAATVPGTPLQSVPLARIACPSRDALAPLQLSTRVPRRAVRALSPPVSADSHAFARLPGVPGRLCPPFLPTRRPASRTNWARTTNSPLTASFVCFEAFFPSRIRSQLTRVAPRQRPLLSWVSSPLECSPTTPRILDPPEPEGSNTPLAPEDTRHATQRNSAIPKDCFAPPTQVEPT